MINNFVRVISYLLGSLIIGICLYFIVIFSLFKFLSFSEKGEEILWNLLVKDSFKIIDNNDKLAKLENYIDKIPPQLWPSNCPKIKIILIQDNKINAYAAPGARVILTTGLLDNANDIAAVFAISHEISHIARKDYLYEFARIQIQNYFFILTRSYIFKELVALIDEKNILENENLADQYAFKIIDHLFGSREGVNKIKVY